MHQAPTPALWWAGSRGSWRAQRWDFEDWWPILHPAMNNRPLEMRFELALKPTGTARARNGTTPHGLIQLVLENTDYTVQSTVQHRTSCCGWAAIPRPPDMLVCTYVQVTNATYAREAKVARVVQYTTLVHSTHTQSAQGHSDSRHRGHVSLSATIRQAVPISAHGQLVLDHVLHPGERPPGGII